MDKIILWGAHKNSFTSFDQLLYGKLAGASPVNLFYILI